MNEGIERGDSQWYSMMPLETKLGLHCEESEAGSCDERGENTNIETLKVLKPENEKYYDPYDSVSRDNCKRKTEDDNLCDPVLLDVIHEEKQANEKNEDEDLCDYLSPNSIMEGDVQEEDSKCKSSFTTKEEREGQPAEDTELLLSIMEDFIDVREESVECEKAWILQFSEELSGSPSIEDSRQGEIMEQIIGDNTPPNVAIPCCSAVQQTSQRCRGVSSPSETSRMNTSKSISERKSKGGNVNRRGRKLPEKEGRARRECKECGATFAQGRYLVRHMHTHTGERRFKCDTCGRGFSARSNLNRHVRTHTEARPYQCRGCEKSFSDSSNLVKHARIHTGERLFRCGDCGKAFTESSTLTRHSARMHTVDRSFTFD